MTFPISTKTIPEEAVPLFRKALGDENFSTDPAICDGYAMQAFHKTEPGCWINRPLAVTLPANTEEVQAIVKICNQFGLRYKAHSTGWGAHGGPGYDNVVQIDLRRDEQDPGMGRKKSLRGGRAVRQLRPDSGGSHEAGLQHPHPRCGQPLLAPGQRHLPLRHRVVSDIHFNQFA